MLTMLNEALPEPVWAGIYEPAEAARYLKAGTSAEVLYPFSSTKLIRWIRHGLAGPDLEHIHGRQLLMDFEDLISMRVIAALLTTGLSWRAIRKAESWLRETTGRRQPFATEILWAGQGQIFTEWGDQLVSGSECGQIALDMIRDYLIPVHGLAFDDETQRATSWEAFDGVVLQPHVQFGAPCIKGTRIPTRSIAGMVEAGDTAHWVAEAYKISVETVLAACEWESRIQAN